MSGTVLFTKAQRGGTGLGLAMVYGMMQRHDGPIEIDSAPGCGTCIRLIFPVREKLRKPGRVPHLKPNRSAPFTFFALMTTRRSGNS